MTKGCRIVCLSQPGGPAVHRYYDVAVESPDAKRIIYFQFHSDDIPGPGSLVIADADGSQPRTVATVQQGAGHIGANQAWIDNDRVAYSPHQSRAGAVVCDTLGRTMLELDSDVRSICDRTRLALLLNECAADRDRAHEHRRVIKRWDTDTSTPDDLVHTDQVNQIHPLRQQFDGRFACFANPKWSPDGERLFLVYSTELYRRISRDQTVPRIKSLFTLNSDGRNLQYIGEFDHHPVWSGDSRSILAYERSGGGQRIVCYDIDGRGEKPRVLLDDAPGVHFTIDRAGRRLVTDVFNQPEVGMAQIMLTDVVDGTRRLLAAGKHERIDHLGGVHPHPQWSRDEQRIYFNLCDTGRSRLYAAMLPEAASPEARSHRPVRGSAQTPRSGVRT